MQVSEVVFTWVMEHPWMTFFIVLMILSVIRDIIDSIFSIFNRKKKNSIEVTILDKDGREIK